MASYVKYIQGICVQSLMSYLLRANVLFIHVLGLFKILSANNNDLFSLQKLIINQFLNVYCSHTNDPSSVGVGFSTALCSVELHLVCWCCPALYSTPVVLKFKDICNKQVLINQEIFFQCKSSLIT